MSTIETVPMWPTPFHLTTNGYAGAHKDELMRLCYRLRDSGERWGISEDFKYNLYESKPTLLDEPEAKNLLVFFGRVLAALVAARGQRLESVDYECWCHITNDGGFHDTHDHREVVQGKGICGIYCVNAGQCDKNNGSIRFYSPNMFESPDTVNMIPRDGQLILFPGHVRHSTRPYCGVDDRVVIAFNAFYRFSGS